jgi:hypothetical protein
MLVAVPSSSSQAAFFVLKGSFTHFVSFHFSRSQALYLSFHSTSSFQQPSVQRLLLLMAHLRVAAGCGLSSVAAKLLLQKFTFLKSIYPCQPLCCKQQRLQTPSFRFAPLRAFSAAPPCSVRSRSPV